MGDAIALKELKKQSPDIFKGRQDVVSFRKLFDEDKMQCEISDGKRAVFFPDLKPSPGKPRGAVARKYLNTWRATCEVGQAEEIAVD